MWEEGQRVTLRTVCDAHEVQCLCGLNYSAFPQKVVVKFKPQYLRMQTSLGIGSL